LLRNNTDKNEPKIEVVVRKYEVEYDLENEVKVSREKMRKTVAKLRKRMERIWKWRKGDFCVYLRNFERR